MKKRARKAKTSKRSTSKRSTSKRSKKKSASKKSPRAKTAPKKKSKQKTRSPGRTRKPGSRSPSRRPSLRAVATDFLGNNFTAAITANQKLVAVTLCVNATMDQSRPNWNHDGQGDSRKMDADYQFNQNSMPAFLGVVQHCLAAKGFTLTITPALVAACVPAKLFELKYRVYQSTK